MAKIQYWHTLERARKVIDAFEALEEIDNEDIDIVYPVGVYLNGSDAGYCISLPTSVRTANIYGTTITDCIVAEVGFKTDFHPKSNIALTKNVFRQIYNVGAEKEAATFIYTWLRYSKLLGFQIGKPEPKIETILSTGAALSMPKIY